MGLRIGETVAVCTVGTVQLADSTFIRFVMNRDRRNVGSSNDE